MSHRQTRRKAYAPRDHDLRQERELIEAPDEESNPPVEGDEEGSMNAAQPAEVPS